MANFFPDSGSKKIIFIINSCKRKYNYHEKIIRTFDNSNNNSIISLTVKADNSQWMRV